MKEESREPGQPIFRYNREERMSSLPEHIGKKIKRGIFRGNRSLLITAIDVVFLLLLVVVFSVLIKLKGDTSVIPGYSVSARAIEYGNRVLVSVTAEKRNDDKAENHARIILSFPDSAERVEISGFLPEKRGDELVFRGALPSIPGKHQVLIELFAGQVSGSILSRIRNE